MHPALGAILATVVLLAACSPASSDLPTVAPTFQPSADMRAARRTSSPEETVVPGDSSQVYHSDKAGFSILIPATWHESNAGGTPVVFTEVAWMGTTLINKTMEIGVAENSTSCQETRYRTESKQILPGENVVVNGVGFLKESGLRTTGGNIQDWTSYSTMRGNTCINLTFVLHSVAPGFYKNKLLPFDKAAESAVFDELLNTFQFDN